MKITGDMVRLKRVYEEPAPEDGFRVLVDRLWPRGLSKAAAEVDLWMKEAAPSTDLRKWYHQDLARWPEFRRRYLAELADPDNPALGELRAIVRAHAGGERTGKGQDAKADGAAEAGAGRASASRGTKRAGDGLRGVVTLVYGAKDEAQNHAIVLREALLGASVRKVRPSR